MDQARHRFTDYSDVVAGILCIIIAITLQIQITTLSSPTYLGLRINLTDLIVPFAGLAILISLLKKQSLWPQWRLEHFYGWVCAITLLFGFALINSQIQYGQLSTWGLINKLIGWLVLATIMGIGGWVGTNARQIHIERFLKIFLYLALIILVYQVIIMVAQSYPLLKQWTTYNKYVYFPIAGMMANRNAYALFIMGAVALSTCFYFSKTEILKPFFVYALYFLLPFFVVYNGSRTAFITLSLMTIAILACHWKHGQTCIRLLLFLLLGCAVFAGIYHDKREDLHFISTRMIDVVVQAKDTMQQGDIMVPTALAQKIENSGDAMRLTIIEDALEMIERHPIIGSGLGSVFFYQEQKHGRMINLIDCTPLWLLVETGAIGLIMFTLFYFRIIKSLYRSVKTDEEFSRTLRIALFYIVGSFTVMCLLHEIMYTRHMWFLIGLGLGLPSRMRQGG